MTILSSAIAISLLYASAASDPAKPKTPVTRVDLANAFLRFEQAFEKKPLTDREQSDVNRSFDALTMMFFSGNMGGAIQRLNALTASLTDQKGSIDQALASLKVRISPRVYVLDHPVGISAHIASLYPVDTSGSEDSSITLAIQRADGRDALSTTIPLPKEKSLHFDQSFPLDAASASLAPGRYFVVLRGSGTAPIVVDRWTVLRSSLDPRRQANEVALKKITASSPILAQALAAATARNKLLTDAPNETQTTAYLADADALSRELDGEIKALQAGVDPYAGRRGDYWRVLRIGTSDAPLRVFVPPSLDLAKPAPFVIALHGAGGDENMFMDAYGAGLIKRLAEKHGFILATPATGYFANPKALDLLLETLPTEYKIDLDRVYVIGHSMGGGVTDSLARQRSDVLAAVCCLAGGGRGASIPSKTPPMLMVGAELDPLVPAARLAAYAKSAKESNLPVEYRSIPNQGHTLVVATQLPSAIQWLLDHRRSLGK